MLKNHSYQKIPYFVNVRKGKIKMIDTQIVHISREKSFVTKSVPTYNVKEIINIFSLGGPLFFPSSFIKTMLASKMIMKLIIFHEDCFLRINSAVINSVAQG